MSDKLIVGPITKGLKTNVKPFVIDNDSFPTLVNAYQWRGRVKRKRGTSFLNRLRRTLPEISLGTTGASPWAFNLFSFLVPTISVTEPNASIVPGSVTITINSVPIITFTDNGDGTLSGFKIGIITGADNGNPVQITSVGHTLITGDTVTINGVLGEVELNGNTYTITVTGVNTFTLDGVNGILFGLYGGGGTWTSPSAANFGTINYVTGDVVLTHTAGAGIAAVVCFSYYPNLPVMGFRDFQINSTQFPGNLAFDTKYSYNVIRAFPYIVYDVSYYKNPAADATNLPGYVPKTTWTPLTWNGQNYQQFYTVNYQGALWATNGIEVPFDITNIGMQFKVITGVAIVTAGNGIFGVGNIPAVANITIVSHGLVVGDFVFINEVFFDPTIPSGISGINFQTGYVTAIIDANTVTVTFPFAILGGAYVSGGIAQYLTSRSDPTKDVIRWYDGDPTDGALSCLGFTLGKGWVNFMPPLSRDVFSIADLPEEQYYLVGAKIIAVYKDRLLFLGPVVQASNGNPIYLQDTVVFSQNGTPYYTTSFFYDTAAPTDPTLSTIDFHPILLPINQTATASAWFEDQPGFGGFLSAGLDEPIFTVGSNEDALIVGFDSIQTRLVYTGNDIIPFLFYIINSELGSSSTFSVIQMDQGVITRGDRGITITGQTQTQRIDLDIPDEVFEMKMIDNGSERVCSERDFINEWAYFTYPSNKINYVFPTKTLLYNYRDNSWGIFFESFTCYGQFNRLTGFIWSTVGFTYHSWEEWVVPWNAGESTLLEPEIVGGNQQGFLLVRDKGIGEGNSLYIKSFSGSTVTSPDHCLNEGDFIIISGVLGTLGQQVNGKIFQIDEVTSSTFVLDPTIIAGTYLGGGLIKRMYAPFIQTKQFPSFWGAGRKTRIGQQQYLLDTTASSQITLLIFLNQNSSSAYNIGPIIPQNFPDNSALIFSSILFTCPETMNLGLTPYDVNLQAAAGQQQDEIWHRINTSLIGDTVQLGFTLSEDQMRSLTASSSSFAITGATATNPCVLACTGNFGAGTLIRITGVLGMIELNGGIFNVLSSTLTTVTIEVDANAFTAYISGGSAVVMAPINQFAEIVLHGMILDIYPSMVLS